MIREPGSARARRARRRFRRFCILLSIALIGSAVLLFTSINVSSDGTHEWIASTSATQNVLLPLGLLAAGVIGLALCLP